MTTNTRKRKMNCAIEQIKMNEETITEREIARVLKKCGVTNQQDITYIFDETAVLKGRRTTIRNILESIRRN